MIFAIILFLTIFACFNIAFVKNDHTVDNIIAIVTKAEERIILLVENMQIGIQ